MQEKLLTVKNLKTYFFTASGVSRGVDGVSFTLGRGETLGIVGESGSGKSVTASSIIRLVEHPGKVVGGSIVFDGREITGLSKAELRAFRGRDVSYIFQNPMTSLDPVFTIGHQMVEVLRMQDRSMTKAEAKKRAIEALRAVNIPQPEIRFNAYPHELSGGMCQRVIIAMTVACAPKLIIADEPTTALDVTVQSQVLKLLKKTHAEYNTAILLITHNLGVVWEMCDTVMVMYAGKTVEYAPVQELYANPLHPYTWGLLDSMPSICSTPKQPLKQINGTPPDLRLTGHCCNFCNRCPYAQSICSEKVPELKKLSPGHFVACHLQDDGKHLTRG